MNHYESIEAYIRSPRNRRNNVFGSCKIFRG